jgi:hypothetical protein
MIGTTVANHAINRTRGNTWWLFLKTLAARQLLRTFGGETKMKRGMMMISILGSILGLFGCNKSDTSQYKTADIYRELRQQVFAMNPEKIGVTPSASNSVWGIVMETGYPEAVVTLVSLADGTVSLYFSNGGGIIGVGQHEGPRKASKEFLTYSQQFLGQATSTKTFPLPSEGKTRFYFLTSGGIFTTESKEDDLGNNRLPLSPLFFKAQEVITQARIVDGKMRAEQGR